MTTDNDESTEVFSAIELDYLHSQRLGRLATQQPGGTLQVSPVGFAVDAASGTIDIHGFGMSASRKFRNVQDNGRVAFVVDDLPSVDPWRVRCVEIRGTAEALVTGPNADDALIRIHPRRIISFGIGDDRPPHQLRASRRDVRSV